MAQKLGRRIPDSTEIEYKENETDESMSSSSSSDDEEEIAKELADVTFEELQKARSNGTHVFLKKRGEDKKLKRANKNRPMEASSKKPVPAFRDVIQAPKKVVRDPRFESLCGTLDSDGFRKRYNFLYENDLLAERQAIKKELKKCKDPQRISEIEERISWIDKQLKSDSSKKIETQILAKHKKKEREKQQKRENVCFISRNPKSESKGLLKNIMISSRLENLNLILRKRGRGMLQRTIGLCHIEDLVTTWSKVVSLVLHMTIGLCHIINRECISVSFAKSFEVFNLLSFVVLFCEN